MTEEERKVWRREYQRKWREAHHDKARAYTAAYRAAHAVEHVCTVCGARYLSCLPDSKTCSPHCRSVLASSKRVYTCKTSRGKRDRARRETLTIVSEEQKQEIIRLQLEGGEALRLAALKWTDAERKFARWNFRENMNHDYICGYRRY